MWMRAILFCSVFIAVVLANETNSTAINTAVKIDTNNTTTGEERTFYAAAQAEIEKLHAEIKQLRTEFDDWLKVPVHYRYYLPAIVGTLCGVGIFILYHIVRHTCKRRRARLQKIQTSGSPLA